MKAVKKTVVKKAVKKPVKKVELTKDWGVIGVEEETATGSQGYATIQDFNSEISSMNEATANHFREINKEMLERTKYQGWLVSPDIKKRCAAILGHMLAAQVVIFIALFVVSLLFS